MTMRSLVWRKTPTQSDYAVITPPPTPPATTAIHNNLNNSLDEAEEQPTPRPEPDSTASTLSPPVTPANEPSVSTAEEQNELTSCQCSHSEWVEQ